MTTLDAIAAAAAALIVGGLAAYRIVTRQDRAAAKQADSILTPPELDAGPGPGPDVFTMPANTSDLPDDPPQTTGFAQWRASLQWIPPQKAEKYLGLIYTTETREGIPPGLLGALLERESAFDPAAYNNRSGASGIAQIVPRWHPTVDPWNPNEAIPYAGNYLRSLYDQFGSWRLALAAYNWGPGNLSRYGIDNAPSETVNYVAWVSARSGVV